MSTSVKPVIGVHVIKDPEAGGVFVRQALDQGNFLPVLRERGLDVVVTNKASFDKGGVWLSPSVTKDGELSFSEEHAAVDGLVAVYSRVVLSHPYIDTIGVPQLNPTSVKEYGRSKSNMIGSFGELGIPTSVVSDESLDDLDLENFEDFVVKPANGRLGAGFQRVSRQDVVSTLEHVFSSNQKAECVVQPYLGVGKISGGIVGVSKEDQALIELARQNNVPSELRIFVIKNSTGCQTIPVLRIAAKDTQYLDGNDVYVDVELTQDVDVSLCEYSAVIVGQTAQTIGTESPIVAAVDYLYDGNQYWVMEANFRTPTLPQTSSNPHTAKHIYPVIADTLYEMNGGGQ
ncbi:hypothetical protein KBD20_01680 [Candidatus Saccharibacteria bacterium]|nr:hypothetical protein [Candidatus Saccharibacteria bacterium]